MDTGETVAVKVLGTNSRQGEQEFLTEVIIDYMLRFLYMCLYPYVCISCFEKIAFVLNEVFFMAILMLYLRNHNKI